MDWEKGVIGYDFFVYDGSNGSVSALAKKDLYISLKEGKRILKEMYSLSESHTIGELNIGDTVVVVFGTVLILKRKKHQPMTSEMILSRISERLEHIERMMEEM